jgi:hypothetical protein
LEITLGIEAYNGTVIVRLESKDGRITEIPTRMNPAFVLAMQGLHPVSPRQAEASETVKADQKEGK